MYFERSYNCKRDQERKIISHNFQEAEILPLQVSATSCTHDNLPRQFMLVWAVNICTAAVYHSGDIEHLDNSSNRSCLQVFFKIASNPISRNYPDF
jgi:hypothetical protein